MKKLTYLLCFVVFILQTTYANSLENKIISINFSDGITQLKPAQKTGVSGVEAINWNNIITFTGSNDDLKDSHGNSTGLSLLFSGDGLGHGSQKLSGDASDIDMMRWGLRSIGPRIYTHFSAQLKIQGLKSEFPLGYEIYVYLSPLHQMMGAVGAIYLGGDYTAATTTPAMPPSGFSQKIDFNVPASLGFNGKFTKFNGTSIAGNYGVFSNLSDDDVVISVNAPSRAGVGTWFDAVGIAGIQIVGKETNAIAANCVAHGVDNVTFHKVEIDVDGGKKIVELASMQVSDDEFETFSGAKIILSAYEKKDTNGKPIVNNEGNPIVSIYKEPSHATIQKQLAKCFDFNELDFIFLVADRGQSEWKELPWAASPPKDEDIVTYRPAIAHHLLKHQVGKNTVPGFTTFQFSSAFKNGPTLHEVAHQWANYDMPAHSAFATSEKDPITKAAIYSEYSVGKGGCSSCGHWGVSDVGGQLGGYSKLIGGTNQKLWKMPSAYVKCTKVAGKDTCPLGDDLTCSPDSDNLIDGPEWLKKLWNDGKLDSPYCHKSFSSSYVCSGADCLSENMTFILKDKPTVEATPTYRKVQIGTDFNHPKGGFSTETSINDKPYSALELYLMGVTSDKSADIKTWSNITFYNRSTGAFASSDDAPKIFKVDDFKKINQPKDKGSNDFYTFTAMPIVVTVQSNVKELKSIAEDFYWFTKQKDSTDKFGANREAFNFWKATKHNAIIKADNLTGYIKKP